MSQQINLYNPIFLKQEKHFSARAMAQALGIIALALVALYAYALLQARQADRTAQQHGAQLAAEREQLAKLGAQLAGQGRSKVLEAQVARLEVEVAKRQATLEALGTNELGNTSGFSDFLAAFGRQAMPGVWLTGIGIAESGNGLVVSGRALRPELVPAYLGSLNTTRQWQGRPRAFCGIQRESATRNRTGARRVWIGTAHPRGSRALSRIHSEASPSRPGSKAMKALIRRYAERIDAATLRERAMIFAAAACLLVYLANMVLLDPLRARQKTVALQTAQQLKELEVMQAETRRMALSVQVDPDAPNRETLKALLGRLMEFNARIAHEQRRFTPPDRMRGVLEEMLQRHRGLALVDLKTLPAAPVETPRAGAAQSAGLYRHGIEFTVAGTYGDLYEYLRALESLSTQLYWRQADLSVTDHPLITLKLTVYTVSFDPAWLIV